MLEEKQGFEIDDLLKSKLDSFLEKLDKANQANGESLKATVAENFALLEKSFQRAFPHVEENLKQTLSQTIGEVASKTTNLSSKETSFTASDVLGNISKLEQTLKNNSEDLKKKLSNLEEGSTKSSSTTDFLESSKTVSQIVKHLAKINLTNTSANNNLKKLISLSATNTPKPTTPSVESLETRGIKDGGSKVLNQLMIAHLRRLNLAVSENTKTLKDPLISIDKNIGILAQNAQEEIVNRRNQKEKITSKKLDLPPVKESQEIKPEFVSKQERDTSKSIWSDPATYAELLMAFPGLKNLFVAGDLINRATNLFSAQKVATQAIKAGSMSLQSKAVAKLEALQKEYSAVSKLSKTAETEARLTRIAEKAARLSKVSGLNVAKTAEEAAIALKSESLVSATLSKVNFLSKIPGIDKITQSFKGLNSILSKIPFVSKILGSRIVPFLGPIMSTIQSLSKFKEGDIAGAIFKGVIAVAGTVSLVGAAFIGGIPALLIGVGSLLADLLYEFVPWKKLGMTIGDWWKKNFGGGVKEENKPQLAALEKLAKDNSGNQRLDAVRGYLKSGKAGSVEEALAMVKGDVEALKPGRGRDQKWIDVQKQQLAEAEQLVTSIPKVLGQMREEANQKINQDSQRANQKIQEKSDQVEKLKKQIEETKGVEKLELKKQLEELNKNIQKMTPGPNLGTNQPTQTNPAISPFPAARPDGIHNFRKGVVYG